MSKTNPVQHTCMEPCPIEKGMRRIGGKWKGSIIYHLKDGPVRFNQLSRAIGGATKKMISTRLKELEREGLVIRTQTSERPLSVSYELTEFGHTALSLLDALREWSEAHEL